MTTYINGKYRDGSIETIDEFESRKEACKMIKEYRLAMPEHQLWLSSRSTNDWKAK